LAGVSTIGARYWGDLWPFAADHHRVITLALLTGAMVLNVLGVKLEQWAQRLLTSSKLLALVVVGVAALWHGLSGGVTHASAATPLAPMGAADTAAYLA